jgi:hypothetical protein
MTPSPLGTRRASPEDCSVTVVRFRLRIDPARCTGPDPRVGRGSTLGHCLDFVAGGAGGCAFAAEGGFDEQHRGVEREDRRVGGGDRADDHALRGAVMMSSTRATDANLREFSGRPEIAASIARYSRITSSFSSS